MSRQLLKLKIGDVFSVPLPRGGEILGQVLVDVDELGCVGCAFFSETTKAGLLPSLVSPFAVFLVTPESLQRHVWPVLGSQPVQVPQSDWPWEAFRAQRWIGAVILGSGIVSDFLGAYRGLLPWDQMADPTYFDGLLLPGVPRPNAAYYAKL